MMAYLFQINPEHGLCEYVEECQSYSQEVDVGGPGKNHRNKSYSAKHRGSLNVYVQGGRFFFSEHKHIDVCEQSPQTENSSEFSLFETETPLNF